MCNLYSQKNSLQEIRDWFDVKAIDPSAGNLPEQKAIFPAYNAPVVYLESNDRKITMMKWGFVLGTNQNACNRLAPIPFSAISIRRGENVVVDSFEQNFPNVKDIDCLRATNIF